MKGLGILILCVLFFWLVWPYIARWLKRMAIRKAESYFRKKMGMPPHSDDIYGTGTRQKRNYKSNYSHEPIIPKEYAEDVDFVETKDFSRYDSFSQQNNSEKYHESQISDAEWTEIKSGRSK